MPVHFTRVLVGLELELKAGVFQAAGIRRPDGLAARLAIVVDRRVRAEGIGYYPALDYFRGGDGPVARLIDEFDGAVAIGWHQVRHRLQGHGSAVFSQIRVLRLLAPAYALPRVRPVDEGARRGLARLYSPRHARVDVEITALQKGVFEGIEEMIARQVARWLKEDCSEIRIVESRCLGD